MRACVGWGGEKWLCVTLAPPPPLHTRGPPHAHPHHPNTRAAAGRWPPRPPARLRCLQPLCMALDDGAIDGAPIPDHLNHLCSSSSRGAGCVCVCACPITSTTSAAAAASSGGWVGMCTCLPRGGVQGVFGCVRVCLECRVGWMAGRRVGLGVTGLTCAALRPPPPPPPLNARTRVGQLVRCAHHPAVDLCSHHGVAHVGVDVVGKVNHSGTLGGGGEWGGEG